jgi:hypothetical protein
MLAARLSNWSGARPAAKVTNIQEKAASSVVEATMKKLRVVLSLLAALALMAGASTLGIAGEKPERASTNAAVTGGAVAPQGAPAKASKGSKAPAAAQAKQPDDAEYTAKIREYTTDKMFLTELVDHLPASATVPSPMKVLGYAIGTPGKLTYTKDIHRYYRELAKATPRVKVWSVGTSEEGREFLLVAVTDESNMAQLDKFKQITARLADPRKMTDAEAETLIKDGKPFYWNSGAIHSPETGSPEMLMELAYRLAVEDTPFIQNIRKNLIWLITPVVEVDGRDRMVDLYNYRKANEGKPAPGLVYWGKYVAHDNNRDGMAQSLELSKVMMRNFLEWHPQVLHDLHESVPFLYTSTGTGPYNAWLDPIVVSEWQKLAYYEIEEMTKRGVPGVWTHGFYDGWAANYMFYVANGHNSIGRFYETFGNGGADTRMRNVPANSTSRTWFRPNPPLPRVKWSLRNNINMQQSGVLLALTYTAEHGQEFLRNFYLKGKRSVAKATTEGPAAWVIPGDGKRPALAADLMRLMQRQGIEVHKLDAEVEVKAAPPPPASAGPVGPRPAQAAGEGERAQGAERRGAAPQSRTMKLPAGSYVIRMDQPYSRMADMLLDTQFYSVADPRPYDDTGWTLGPLRNVVAQRITDTSILSARMSPLSGPVLAAGGITGTSATKYYVVNATAEPQIATLRFKLKDVKIFAAEEAFEADSKKFNAGSFLIPTEGNPADLRARVETAVKELGLTAHATDVEIKAARHTVALPRIALMHTWINTQNEGWFRLALDELRIPFDYISDQDVRATPNLRSKYDVILFAPVTSSIVAMIHGIRKRTLADGSDMGGAIPWKNTPLTPNLAGPNSSKIDETDDIRGGLGFEGVANLQRFVTEGGVFIPITASASLPVELGITEGVSIVETRNLQARGAVFNATIQDKGSPIAYGYDDQLALYFSQAPVFSVGLGGGGFGGGGGGGAPGAAGGRVTGRGTATDPDIPQGRPWQEPEREPRRSRAERELFVDPDNRDQIGVTIPPPRMWPRVVVRWATEQNLFVSGMLAGGSELAESPAIIDVPVGKGHVVLFGSNPMWRHQTQGAFMLLLNAALHFDHLHVGRAEPRASERRGEGDADDWNK